MGLNVEENLCWRKNYKKSCTYTDIKVYRHRCSSFLMFSEKRLVQSLQRNFINFLTEMGIHLC